MARQNHHTVIAAVYLTVAVHLKIAVQFSVQFSNILINVELSI